MKFWLAFLALQLADKNASTQFWPVTGAGWVALVSSIIALLSALIGGLWSYFRVLSHIDGSMKRVAALEDWRKAEEGRELEKTLAYERMTNAQEHLLQKIGEAFGAAQQCGTDTAKFADEVKKEIRAFRDEFTAADKESERRFTRMETQIEDLRRKQT